jgi:hypothetical protein
MNGHIDADGLAEYRVGLITGRRGRQIAEHLAACAQCTSVADRLAEVSIVLAAVPLPTMPDSVASRIEAAFAVEFDVEKAVVAPPRSRFRLPRLALPRLTLPRPALPKLTLPKLTPARLLAPAAAVAALAAGGFGLSQLASSPASQPSFAGPASAAAGSARSAGEVPAPTSFATGHADDGMSMAPEGSLMIAAGDTDLHPATLGQQLNALFGSRSRLHSTRASAAVRACVSAVVGSRVTDLVASARYLGAPATVVVTGNQAFVAGPSCSATDSDIIARAVVSPGISTP